GCDTGGVADRSADARKPCGPCATPALATTASGALVPARQAGRKLDIGFPGRGMSSAEGGGLRKASVNHDLRSAPQPSPPVAGGCGLQVGLSAGQRMRTWKW